jgi:hypothetical protein
MQWLLASYTIGFQRRHQRVGYGHLFQGRFKSHLVEPGTYLLSLSRYVHLNPVRGRAIGRGELRARRQRLRAYRWSSLRGYVGLERPFKFISEELVLGEMAQSLPRRVTLAACRQSYRRFVEDGLLEPLSNPSEELIAQAVLGSERFVQKVADQLSRMADQRHERTAERQLKRRTWNRAGEEQVKAVLRIAAQTYGTTPAELADRGARSSWSEGRGVVMALLRRTSDLTLSEIGALMGGAHYQAVAQRIRRIEQRGREGLLRVRLSYLEQKCQTI